MTVGKFISNGFTAMLEHSINKNDDTLAKNGINQPQPKSTNNFHSYQGEEQHSSPLKASMCSQIKGHLIMPPSLIR
jgi:hypothetical protein